MEKHPEDWGNSAAITTKSAGYTAVEFTIKIPSTYSVSGAPNKHYISMYAGPYAAGDTPENARCEAGIMIFPKDSPKPDSRGPMAIVNPGEVGGRYDDGHPEKYGQRNLALELFEEKNHPGEYRFRIVINKSNEAQVYVIINGEEHEFKPKDAISSKFTFGQTNLADASNPIGFDKYPNGIKWKFDIGFGDRENPNVSFNGAKISDIRAAKKGEHGELQWVSLTGKDFELHTSKALPGAHFNKHDCTLEASRAVIRQAEPPKDKPVEIQLNDHIQRKPADPLNPLFNLTPLSDNKRSLQNDPIHDTALSSMIRMNEERGIPTDQRTYNAAAYIAAAGHEKGLKEINLVMPSNDGEKLVAVQGQPGTSHPNKVVVVSTTTALNTPVDQSNAAYAKAALEKSEQPAAISNQQNQQIDPATTKAPPSR